MISNRFIKWITKISGSKDKNSTTVLSSEMPFSDSQEGVKVFRTGPLAGVPMSPVDFKKCQCRMSLSLIYMPMSALCCMSNLRKGYGTCHYNFYPPVACQQALCCMSNLRKCHVALLILGVTVKGH